MKRTLLILMVACGLALGALLAGPAEAGKSYSSGGSSFSRPSSSSFGGSRPAGRSFSTGGSSAAKSFSPKSPSSAGKSASWTPSVAKPAASASSRPATSTKPSGGSFDSAAAAAQRHEESKAAFTQAQKPRTTYTTPQGQPRKLDPEDQRVERIRREVDVPRWSMREERRRVIYVLPPQTAPLVVYHDPYSDWFWFWLLNQNLDARANWAYHYRDQMDAARYRDLLAKDAQLEARIRELEAKKVVRDPTYVPPGVDNDLMYDDGFVAAAVNPQPAPPTVTHTPTPRPPPAHRHTILGALWIILLILAGMAFFVWLVFIKRWGGT